MFEVGFWELALIGAVALLVVGPEKLPSLARTVGIYVGKIRRIVAQAKEDIEREVRADELRRSMDEAETLRQTAFRQVDEARAEIQAGVDGVPTEVKQRLREAGSDRTEPQETEEVGKGGQRSPQAVAADHERRPES